VNAFLKIVLYPFAFWTKAVVTLAEQKKPIYDPTVGLNLNLLFDGLTFLSYPLGVFGVLVSFVADKWYKLPFVDMVTVFFTALIVVYTMPVIIWLTSIVFRYCLKLAVVVVKILWTAVKTFVLKIYNFIVNPQWHFAIKHIHKQE
jgi:hypothetical protein